MVDRLELGVVVAMRAEAFSYVRIDAPGFFTPAQLVTALSDSRLGEFLRGSRRTSVLLNASLAERIGTDDTDWLGATWAPMIASIGVRKLALVSPEPIHQLFGQVFQLAARKAAGAGIELRCFPSGQFHQTWESVTWFDDPGGAGGAAGAGGAPVVESRAPSLRGSIEVAVPRDHWSAVFASAAAGGAVTGAATMSAWLGMVRSLGLAEVMFEPSMLLPAALVGVVSGLAGTYVVLLLRDWPRTRIGWGEQTIIEYVGERARTTVDRARMRAVWTFSRVQFVRNRRAIRSGIGGRMLQLSDGSGPTITVAEGEFRAPWLRNQPCQVTSLEPLLALVPSAAEGAIVPSDRAYHHRTSVFFGLLAVMAYGAFCAGIVLTNTRTEVAAAAFSFLVGAALFGLRALWPTARLFRRALGGRLAAGAELVLRLFATTLVGVPPMAWLLIELVNSAMRH